MEQRRAGWRAVCTAAGMITTNLPQFVEQLSLLGEDVQVHDHADLIEIQLTKPVDLDRIDDMVCDALFADPLQREEGPRAWTVHLGKREHLRRSADMRVVHRAGSTGYVVHPSA